jgi:hypothetical protein
MSVIRKSSANRNKVSGTLSFLRSGSPNGLRVDRVTEVGKESLPQQSHASASAARSGFVQTPLRQATAAPSGSSATRTKGEPSRIGHKSASIRQPHWHRHLDVKRPTCGSGTHWPSHLPLLNPSNQLRRQRLLGGYRIYETDMRIALAWAYLAACDTTPRKNGPDSRSAESGLFFCHWHPKIIENRRVRCQLPRTPFEQSPHLGFERFGQH